MRNLRRVPPIASLLPRIESIEDVQKKFIQFLFTEEYMAPEVIKKEAYGLMVDWSAAKELDRQ